MEAELNQCPIEKMTCKAKTHNVVAQSSDKESLVEEAAAEKNKQERGEIIHRSDGEVVNSDDQKTANEGNINSEDNQISSISNTKDTKEMSTENTEKNEEEIAYVQPAGADIEGCTKEQQQCTKSAANFGFTDCGAQADSTIIKDTMRASNKHGNHEKERSECSADLPRSTIRPKLFGRASKLDIAEKFGGELADCPALLDIEDMMQMKVPDSKCVQELYRCLVAKGLVKTKKA